MRFAPFAYVWLIGILLTAELLFPIGHPPPAQRSPSLIERGYELLPNARWLEELSRDEAPRIGADLSALIGARPRRPSWDGFRWRNIDFALEVKRSLRSYSLDSRAIVLSMPHRPRTNENFMFNERDTAWGAVMEALYYWRPVFFTPWDYR